VSAGSLHARRRTVHRRKSETTRARAPSTALQRCALRERGHASRAASCTSDANREPVLRPYASRFDGSTSDYTSRPFRSLASSARSQRTACALGERLLVSLVAARRMAGRPPSSPPVREPPGAGSVAALKLASHPSPDAIRASLLEGVARTGPPRAGCGPPRARRRRTGRGSRRPPLGRRGARRGAA
jgi:hypothetical protein